jgi:hypothetical protein
VFQQPWVLGAADAVPDALRAQAKGIPDAARAGCLARMDRGREAGFAGKAECRREQRSRVTCLVPREIDPRLVRSYAAGSAGPEPSRSKVPRRAR